MNRKTKRKSITFADALEGYWLARRSSFSKATIDDYTLTFTRFAAFIGDQPLAEISAPDVQRFLAAMRDSGCTHAILRTSWVFSAHGANFVKTMLRLSETRDTLSVVDDQVGCPTPAADIAAALLAMAAQMRAGRAGGIYHFGGQPPVSWADFAREIFNQSGRNTAVTGIPSADYPTPASRPLNSRLDCSRLTADFGIKPPAWQEGLAAVLQQLGVKA